ncbi:peptidoglycan D,D-transpeptidase FtsI family protein [Alicyclobacillus pomorum]|uniref:peptidoglycan D,D-transpeptidase FtsI family protein n=1 Tax=Alicyclobacillus pomorum TaxID=204470 RepID=UPI0003F526C9|nr:penicillin-binding transpeptidase domain-containing protein [Alicyclobacillus pomorum]
MKRLRRKSKFKEEPTQRGKRSQVFRVNVLYGLVFLSFSSLILRLGYLQISQGANMRAQAMNYSMQLVPTLPARGRIYDTNGNLIAYNQPTYNVYLTRIKHVNDSPQMIQKMADILAPVFHTTPQDVVNQMSALPQDATVRLFANDKVTEAQLSFIGEHHSDLPGISVQMNGQRVYPYGDLAAQVLGYVGPILSNDQNYFLNQKHYLRIQQVGETGIERVYEQYLQGKVGYQAQQVNLLNDTTENLGYDPPPVAGDNIQLTLDGTLQADAQNAVLNAIQSYESQNNTQITDGAAVMIDLKTGGVLAMVSYPYYDPNWFINGDFLKHAQYLKSSGAQLNNVIQSPLYPGSTVKPANLLTGLEHGVVTPDTIFDDSPNYQYIGTFRMPEDASYGPVSDTRAIAVSDDRFFYTLGLNLGHWFGSSPTSGGYPDGGNLQTWRNTYFIKGLMTLIQGEMRFGLGVKTGIDLLGEVAGRFYMENNGQTVPIDVPKVEKSLQTTGSFPNYGSPADLAFMAFGQSQQFTPIQLAEYVSTIANNGKKLQLHLLKAVYPPGMEQTLQGTNAKPIQTYQTKVLQQLNLNPTYLSIVQQGMYDACNESDGTAYPVFGNAPYKAAGKTGTAEISMNGHKVNNSVFIGYAPYDNPQVAVAVMVPGAGYGAVTAVPIARQMMDDYFKEHHEFFPQNQWINSSIPSSWFDSPAYKQPENTQ